MRRSVLRLPRSLPNSNFLGTKNPNGFGSGTSFRLYPCDEEGENNGTNNGC